jgi:hypothetical protein
VPEVYALADAVPERFRLLVLLATSCSLRWGELAALTHGAGYRPSGTPYPPTRSSPRTATAFDILQNPPLISAAHAWDDVSDTLVTRRFR